MVEGLGVAPALPAALFARPPLPELPRGANQAVCLPCAFFLLSLLGRAHGLRAGQGGKETCSFG